MGNLKDQRPRDPREVVRSFDGKGDAVFGRLGIQEIDYRGRFGAIAYSTTENTISIGDKIFVLDDDGEKFKIGDDVLISSGDPDAFMWGEVVNKDTTVEPCRLTIYVDDVSTLTSTYNDWEIQVVARPKPGIEKDVSTSSVAFAAVGSTMTFAVTASKFFPLGGKLLLKALTSPKAVAVGKVLAYSSTTLVMEIGAKSSAATGTFSSWSIALLDAPQDLLNKYVIQGLRVTPNSLDFNDIDITPGRILDSTGTVNIELPAGLTKQLDAAFSAGTNQGAYTQSGLLAGTVTASAGNLSGSGTAFVTDFGASGGTITDLSDQFTKFGTPLSDTDSIIAATGQIATTITTVTDADTATVNPALTFGSATYRRGGFHGTLGNVIHYAICVIRKDSDGSVDICASAFTGSGDPDLPAGYTYYRAIAYIRIEDGDASIKQPLVALNTAVASLIVDDKYDLRLVLTADNIRDNLDIADGHLNTLLNRSGTYTPTTTAVSNLDGNPAAAAFKYMRIGDYVHVAGRTFPNPTAGAGTQTVYLISLPVASNFTDADDAAGVAASPSPNESGNVTASVASDAAVVTFAAQSTAGHNQSVSFIYRIL